jgi:PAS domain S-box-containing protein
MIGAICLGVGGVLFALLLLYVDRVERQMTTAQESLRDSEDRFRTLFNSASDAIFIHDFQGQMQEVNEIACERLGYSHDELLKMTPVDFNSPDQVPRVPKRLKELQEKGYIRFETTHVDRNGKLIPVEIISRTLEDKGKGTVISTARDITELKQAAAELKKHRDHLKELIAERTQELTKTNEQLQQEIRERRRTEETLLTYHKRMRSLASALSLAEERERRRIATEVHDNVGQNLAFAKMKLSNLLEKTSSGSEQSLLDEVNMLLDEAMHDTRFLVSELGSPVLYELGFVPAAEWLTQQMQKRHGIVMEFQDDGQPKPLSDDVRVLLFQALRELLVNIVRHARAHKAKISIMRRSDHIQIDVEDDGVGFGPTETIPGADKNGFGLFSIRERLQPLGGHMQIASKPGDGTHITLMGPLKSE